MRASVALTTYNGEKYLIELMESLHNQDREVDEVIICDDVSSDNTIGIVKGFIDSNQLQSKWKLIANSENKGAAINSLDCAASTSGDVIFFCDQDDVWEKNKIRYMMEVFETNPRALAVSCSVTIVDKCSEPIKSLSSRFLKGRGGALSQLTFSEQVRRNWSPGHALAVKREAFQRFRPIIANYGLQYDVPFGLFSAVSGDYFLLEEPLVRRRLHDANASFPAYTLRQRLYSVGAHVLGRELHLALLKACYQEFASELPPKDSTNLQRTIRSKELTINKLNNRRILGLFADLFDKNPMSSKLWATLNLAVALFGDYQNTLHN